MGVKNLFNKDAFEKALDDCNLTIAEIAARIGCNANDIYRYKKGESSPRIGRLKQLVEILGPSITGLAFSLNRPMISFTPDERQCVSWFRTLPPPRQARILGYLQAVFEFGNSADEDFAADFAEELIRSLKPNKEQPG